MPHALLEWFSKRTGTGKRADSLDTTLFRLQVLALPFSPTSSVQQVPVAIKTPGICMNFALINEIMPFAIISELISGITWSFPWFIQCILGKFTASFMLNSRKETQSLASVGSKISGLSTLVIEQGLKQRKGCSLIHFFNPVWKL